jgi:hypothetical protein
MVDIHGVKVGVLTVAPRGRVGNAAAVVGKERIAVTRLAVGKQSDISIGQVVAIKLIPLAATDIFGGSN